MKKVVKIILAIIGVMLIIIFNTNSYAAVPSSKTIEVILKNNNKNDTIYLLIKENKGNSEETDEYKIIQSHYQEGVFAIGDGTYKDWDKEYIIKIGIIQEDGKTIISNENETKFKYFQEPNRVGKSRKLYC